MSDTNGKKSSPWAKTAIGSPAYAGMTPLRAGTEPGTFAAEIERGTMWGGQRLVWGEVVSHEGVCKRVCAREGVCTRVLKVCGIGEGVM